MKPHKDNIFLNAYFVSSSKRFYSKSTDITKKVLKNFISVIAKKVILYKNL